MTTVLHHRYGRARSLLRFICVTAWAQPLLHASLHAQQPLALSRQSDSAFIVRALNEVRSRAQAENPGSELARANRARLEAQAKASGLSAPMTFSAGLSEAPIATLDQGNVRAEIGRELRTGTKRRAERALADVEIRMADADITIAERVAAANALRASMSAAALRRIALRLNAEDSLLIDAEETVRSRFSTGDARYVDVLRLRTERLHLQSERSEVVADERLARAGLSALAQPTTRTRLTALIDTLATKPLEELWRVLLPDLENAKSIDSLVTLAPDELRSANDEQRAAAAMELALAGQRSQVSGYAGLQRIGQANNGPTIGPSFGFTMSLPFTAKRANKLSSDASVASITAIRATRNINRAAYALEIAAAVEHYSAQRARLAAFDSVLLRGAREERESALSSYRTGDLSLVELLDFERAISRAEIERLRALIDAVDALADLTRDANSGETTKHNARSER